MKRNATQISRYVNLFKNVRNWRSHFAIKLGIETQETVILELRNTISIEVPVAMYHLFKEIVLDDCYLRGLDGFRSERPFIIDVGANIGFFSLYAASVYPNARIIAYEPMPPNFTLLEKNFWRNESADLTSVNKAVGSVSGTLRLHYHLNRQYPTAPSLFKTNDASLTIDVESNTLEEVLEQWNPGRVDLLKLDCEGAEFGILYESPYQCFEHIDKIAMEVHPRDTGTENTRAVEQHLQSLGYSTATGGRALLWAWRA